MKEEKLKYYQILDSINKECNKQMIRLTFDTAFKSFFSRNPDFLKDFLIEKLNLDMDKDETIITVSNVELPKNIGENVYELRSRFTGEVLIDNFTLHLKNIEYYRDLYYTKGEKLNRASMWLVVLSSENYEELYRTVSQILDEKDTDIFMDEVTNY